MVSVALKKILIVDDEEVIRNFYRDSLTSSGYEVETAEDGVEALERLKESTYDLILTDIKMPRLDGLGFYASAAREYPYLRDRFLFVTGTPPTHSEYFSRIRGRMILKPFRMNDLLDAISQIMSTPLDEQLERSELDRRVGRRLFYKMDCYLISTDSGVHRSVIARTQDISSLGMQIRYFGDSIKTGDRVRLSIRWENGGLKKAGKIVWAHGPNRFVSAGVRFSEPLDASVLDALKKDLR
ncbi:MAG: response regulator [Thermodesulfobacteriota bacterium]